MANENPTPYLEKHDESGSGRSWILVYDSELGSYRSPITDLEGENGKRWIDRNCHTQAESPTEDITKFEFKVWGINAEIHPRVQEHLDWIKAVELGDIGETTTLESLRERRLQRSKIS